MRTAASTFSALLLSAASAASAAVVSACGGTTPKAATASGAAPSATLAESGIEASWMDPTIDPCTDYFAYACGGFVKTTQIPPDRASWGTTSAIEKVNEDYLRGVLEKAAA